MHLKKIYHIFIISNLILLSGCTLVDWGKKTFNQGCPNDIFAQVPRRSMRTIRVYDEFVTLGIFTALPLSNEVIEAYVKLHAQKNEMDDECAHKMLDSEIQRQDGLISFYLLAYVPRLLNPINVPNKVENAPWRVYLNIGGELYDPYKIKVVNLNPEYRLFFGKYITKFKATYLVEFLDKDQNGAKLIDENTREISLCFISLTNRVSLNWKLDKLGRVLPDPENYYCEYENPIYL